MSGLDVCKQLKAKRPSIPIIMLTARGQEVDKVVGLELGADDYVTKPFSIRELLARVKAVLRRTQTLPKDQDRYSFGDVEVNLRSYQVRRGGNPVEFSSKEFDLLKHFLCHSGETLSRERLLDEVWGYENFPTTRTVDAHIVRIRQKLEPVPEQPRFFLTVHGVGYKFVGCGKHDHANRRNANRHSKAAACEPSGTCEEKHDGDRRAPEFNSHPGNKPHGEHPVAARGTRYRVRGTRETATGHLRGGPGPTAALRSTRIGFGRV
jgi:two-component system alkaline phosphatase synthesis response regulator PhoP